MEKETKTTTKIEAETEAETETAVKTEADSLPEEVDQEKTSNFWKWISGGSKE